MFNSYPPWGDGILCFHRKPTTDSTHSIDDFRHSPEKTASNARYALRIGGPVTVGDWRVVLSRCGRDSGRLGVSVGWPPWQSQWTRTQSRFRRRTRVTFTASRCGESHPRDRGPAEDSIRFPKPDRFPADHSICRRFSPQFALSARTPTKRLPFHLIPAAGAALENKCDWSLYVVKFA